MKENKEDLNSLNMYSTFKKMESRKEQDVMEKQNGAWTETIQVGCPMKKMLGVIVAVP